ncbi:5'/3'-nucleotidase SurE [Halomarina salina]|uniref:5'-nucleotidase SurE n=1 Tax=Halomarina salina TaxID=1872699 RepID=A0ABD5RSG3_9EURY|nr:5'/3'-nucleotidase SurE [Halomarina salina]
MNVLLTNDDGIDEAGLRALYDALSDVASVTAVAPADDQSAVGRTLSTRVDVRDHELGYAVEGTPADCVVVGLQSLVPDVDLVVSGCNRGANLGQYTLGRSGTVSAAVEAAFFDVPAIAVSMYVPTDEVDFRTYDPDPAVYGEAARATRFLVEETARDGVFGIADYLNVNAPIADEDASEMVVTEPSTYYDMDAERDGDVVHLYDRIWERMGDGSLPDPEGTDRRAILDGKVSVSPLTAPHTVTHHETLVGLAEEY